VEDVAAATRFKLQLERQEQLSEYEDDVSEAPARAYVLPLRSTSLPYTDAMPASIPDTFPQQESRYMKRRKTPEPIVVNNIDALLEEIQSAPLPSNRPLNSVEIEETSAKSHRRHVTISEARGASRNIILLHTPSGTFSEHTPPMPVLSPSISINTPRLAEIPLTPLSLNPPNEDQIRREIEFFTLQDGAESLVNHRYRHQAPSTFVIDSDDEDDGYGGLRNSFSAKSTRDDDQRSIVSVTPSLKRRKSIFSVFQRKSELDKLLDLYLDDEPADEVQPVKKKSSLARRMTRSGWRKVPEVTDVPALPPTYPSEGLRSG
jgi:hypothetical protein